VLYIENKFETLEFNIEANSTVYELKKIIGEKIGVTDENFYLRLKGEPDVTKFEVPDFYYPKKYNIF
jgi:hypothetical protein